MNILLTNDDGYNSIGIKLLKNKLSKYGRVVICAPKKPMSAKSVSINIGNPLVLTKEDNDIYSLDGTPADCSAFGITSLNIDFDLVVSGCNNGLNVSYDTCLSGTIGACIQAMMCHKMAVAFSCDGNFDLVDKYFDEVWSYIIGNKLLNKDYILNINFPIGDVVKGISISKEYYRNDRHYFIKNEDGYYAYRNVQKDFDDDKNSDCYLVNNGIVSICPIAKTYFDSSLYEKVKNSISK